MVWWGSGHFALVHTGLNQGVKEAFTKKTHAPILILSSGWVAAFRPQHLSIRAHPVPRVAILALCFPMDY